MFVFCGAYAGAPLPGGGFQPYPAAGGGPVPGGGGTVVDAAGAAAGGAQAFDGWPPEAGGVGGGAGGGESARGTSGGGASDGGVSGLDVPVAHRTRAGTCVGHDRNASPVDRARGCTRRHAHMNAPPSTMNVWPVR